MTRPGRPGKVSAIFETRRSVCVVLGTRPGIVKFAPVLYRLQEAEAPHVVIHSGQHYSENMDAVFFDQLGLPQPDFRVGAVRPDVTQGEQTAEMLTGIERALMQERPRVVLVGGDANTNLAGALAARKLGLIVGHVEAGLRSSDWRMSEEHNRVIIDHISDVLFVPSERAKATAHAEGVQGVIHVTGSTIGEVLQRTLASAGGAGPNGDTERVGEGFALVTLHRQETVDDRETLRPVTQALRRVPEELQRDVVWPVHPRTRKRLVEFSLLEELEEHPGIRLLPPVGHREFARLLARAGLMITDSGGVQQEACILRIPCVTVRPTTEWVETVDVGANTVVGTDEDKILSGCRMMGASARDWPDPFSPNGQLPSHRIVDLTLQLLDAS